LQGDITANYVYRSVWELLVDRNRCNV